MSTPSINITMRDPATLAVHPLNRAMPRFVQGMPEWLALCDDISERGFQSPIEVCGRHVVNGWTRVGIAKSLRLEQVPCVEVPEDEVYANIKAQLANQKHLTKGQRAYLLVPIAERVIKEADARKLANLKKGHSPKPIESASGNIGVLEQFCADHGFSKDIFDQARTLHAIWAGDRSTLEARNLVGADVAALREEWEPKILAFDKPVGLGAALAGIAGEQSTRDKTKAPNPEVQLELFTDGAAQIDRVAKAWPKLAKARRPEIVMAWTRVASGWPADLRRELAQALLQGIDGEARA